MATVLITGANRGIGLAFAKVYKGRGARVIGTARDPDGAGELAGIADLVVGLDVSDAASVAALADSLDEPIDLLINNAGLLVRDSLDAPDDAAFLRQVEINALGPLRVTRALRPHLARASAPRIVCITSRMGSIADNTGGGYYGYRASKAALNAVVKSLSVDLSWPVMAVHPGYVRTGMTGDRGDVSPDESVARMVQVIDALDASRTGTFYHRDGQELPW